MKLSEGTARGGQQVATQAALRAGLVAPEFAADEVTATGVARVLAANVWREGPMGLAFLRYAGCPVCQATLATLRRRAVELTARECVLYVVVQSGVSELAEFAATRPPFHLIADPEARLYRLYGVGGDRLGLGTLRSLSPMVLRRVLRATVAHGHGAFGGRETQKPGEFVIGRGGTLLHARVGAGVFDDIDVDAMLNVLPDPNRRGG